MYNLICFPHYTAGGLLADILNNTWSDVTSTGGINSIHHNIGKIGNVDSDTIFTNFTQKEFDSILNNTNGIAEGIWIGTHCWPGHINLDKFNRVVNITTITNRSKIYRWIRSYNLYFIPKNKKIIEWDTMSELDKIDKFRETAKNYLIPSDIVNKPNVINIEFCDIVEENPAFLNIINTLNKNSNLKKHFDRWKIINSFLYDSNLWNNYAVKRLNEAEFECKSLKSYVYL